MTGERHTVMDDQGKVICNPKQPHLELTDWGGGDSDVREGDVYSVYNLKSSDSASW
jgi:hypothetical protein